MSECPGPGRYGKTTAQAHTIDSGKRSLHMTADPLPRDTASRVRWYGKACVAAVVVVPSIRGNAYG
jgi:hypothetical protein